MHYQPAEEKISIFFGRNSEDHQIHGLLRASGPPRLLVRVVPAFRMIFEKRGFGPAPNRPQYRPEETSLPDLARSLETAGSEVGLSCCPVLPEAEPRMDLAGVRCSGHGEGRRGSR